jgi:hypothetical protein
LIVDPFDSSSSAEIDSPLLRLLSSLFASRSLKCEESVHEEIEEEESEKNNTKICNIKMLTLLFLGCDLANALFEMPASIFLAICFRAFWAKDHRMLFHL